MIRLVQRSIPAILVTVAFTTNGCNAEFSINGRSVSSGGYSFDFQGEKATHKTQGEIAAGTKSLVVDNRFGDVTITATKEAFGWDWELTCWSDTAEIAKQYTESIKLEATFKDGQQTLKLVLPKPPLDDLRGIKSNLIVRVPAKARLELENAHGASKIDGIAGGTKARCRHGKLELLNLAGTIDAATEHGDLTARDIEGGTLANKHGDITATNVDGNLTVSTEHGEMQLNSVNASNKFGQLSANNVTGEFRARNEHGKLVADGILGAIDAETSFAKLEINNAGSNAKLRNEHGNINVRGAKGNVDVRTSFGHVDLETPSKQFVCRNEHGKIRIVATNAELQLIDAKTSFDDIQIQIPPSTKPTIEAGTKHGDIDSEFPVLQLNSAVDNFAGLKESAARITLKNEHGDIRVKKTK